MSLRDFFDSMEDDVSYIAGDENRVEIGWSRKGWGFGSFRFYKEGEKWMCDSECMNKQFVKDVLCMLVDQADFVDFPEEKKDDVRTDA